MKKSTTFCLRVKSPSPLPDADAATRQLVNRLVARMVSDAPGAAMAVAGLCGLGEAAARAVICLLDYPDARVAAAADTILRRINQKLSE
jgi:hypothetical protein